MKKNYSICGFALACLLGFVSKTTHAAEFPVTNNNNNGAGSLASAITQANGSPGLDTISFNLPEGSSMTISLTITLPAITEAVFINGYSQPGALSGNISSRTIRINIDGSGLPGGNDIFSVDASGVEIAGLAIYRATAAGIRIGNGADAFIWGNYIGTDSTGLSTGLGNGTDAVVSNTFNGSSNTGTIIGTNGDGTNDANEGNLLSCNGEDGVFFWRTSSSVIAGNIIGFDKDGDGAGFGNGRNGILITQNSDNNVVGTNGDGIADNVEGNRIGNNPGRGILLATISNGNVVAGNIIGLSASNGNAGNGESGVEINPGSNNQIGTNGDGLSDAIERNVICANTLDGVRIVGGDFFGGSNSNDNMISGNTIGTNGAGTLVMGNGGAGISITTNANYNADNNVIGSNNDFLGDDLEGNLIANNAKGVVLATPTGTSTVLRNAISRNSIYDNTGLGIDLGDDGITANDNGDADAGPNELYNFPFIKSSTLSGGSLIITGVAPANAILEFYIADASGEGKTYLFTAQENGSWLGIDDDSTGTDTYSDVTYGSGTDQKFGFTVPALLLPATVTAGTVVVGLAIKTTSFVNSTSEFGPSFISVLPVRLLQFAGKINEGTIQLNWTTADEVNNSHFDIERSSDGSHFQKIGEIAAKGGITNSYAFTDIKPAVVNFYRLRQVDIDGASTLSRVLLLRTDLSTVGAKISPNPFRNNLNISFQSNRQEKILVRLYNLTGQLVKQFTSSASTGINTISVGELGGLPAGTYTIEVRGEQLHVKQRLLKQ